MEKQTMQAFLALQKEYDVTALMSREDVADYLKVDAATLDELISCGELIPAIPSGRLFKVEAIAAYAPVRRDER